MWVDSNRNWGLHLAKLQGPFAAISFSAVLLNPLSAEGKRKYLNRQMVTFKVHSSWMTAILLKNCCLNSLIISKYVI